MRFFFASAALSAAFIGAVVVATGSHAAGLTGLHQQTQIGNRVCFVDHFHYGESGAWPTRSQAVEATAQSWGSLVRLEYGAEWADIQAAHQTDMQCSQVESGRGGLLWNCKAKAVPCRSASPVLAMVPPVASVMAHQPSRIRSVARHPSHFERGARPRFGFKSDGVGHQAPGATLVWPGDRR